MGVDHVLDAVGDDLARGEGIEHSGVAHGDAVVDSDGVELFGDAAGGAHGLGDDVAHFLQVDVAGHELRVGVHDGHDGLAKLVFAGAGCAPQGAGACGLTADGGDA